MRLMIQEARSTGAKIKTSLSKKRYGEAPKAPMALERWIFCARGARNKPDVIANKRKTGMRQPARSPRWLKKIGFPRVFASGAAGSRPVNFPSSMSSLPFHSPQAHAERQEGRRALREKVCRAAGSI